MAFKNFTHYLYYKLKKLSEEVVEDDEIVNGQIFKNGNNNILKFEHTFRKGTTKLYRNGIRQKLNEDYIENSDSASVTLSVPYTDDELFVIDYKLKN